MPAMRDSGTGDLRDTREAAPTAPLFSVCLSWFFGADGVAARNLGEAGVLLAEGDTTALASCGLSLVSITGAKTMSPAAAATLAPPSTSAGKNSCRFTGSLSLRSVGRLSNIGFGVIRNAQVIDSNPLAGDSQELTHDHASSLAIVSACALVTLTRSATSMYSSGAAILCGVGPYTTHGVPRRRQNRQSVPPNEQLNSTGAPRTAVTLSTMVRTRGCAGSVKLGSRQWRTSHSICGCRSSRARTSFITSACVNPNGMRISTHASAWYGIRLSFSPPRSTPTLTVVSRIYRAAPDPNIASNVGPIFAAISRSQGGVPAYGPARPRRSVKKSISR